MSVVYGIQEIYPSGAIYVQNTLYRSKAKAQKEADNYMVDFPQIDCAIVSFWID